MDYIKEYKNFINSYYLAAAIRVCLGALIPAVVMSYFGSLSIGIMAALGATMASPADGPGPIHHRRNGMLVSIFTIFFMAVVTGYLSGNALLLGIWIAIACFGASMIAVYGERANGIGLAALIVMSLVIGRVTSGSGVIMNAIYMGAGATWYAILSLLLHHIRPYRLPQQALGDCVMSTANYLRVRTRFYDKHADYDKTYKQLMEAQVEVHQQQNLLRELLFKSRNITKESTTTSRTLLMIFVDIVDLFEKSTTSFYDYGSLQRHFGHTGVLTRFSTMIREMAEELDNIGLAVKSGTVSKEPGPMQQHLHELQSYFEEFIAQHRRPENIEAIITLRKVMQGIEDISNRVYTLHHYTRYEKNQINPTQNTDEYKVFVTSQSFSWKLLPANLSLDSNIFRHSLRVSVAAIAGYLIAIFFQLGHSYWILLTTIAILKPTFSLTTKRNYERLIGTVAGALFGILLLLLFQDRTVLFVWMLVLMIGAYSFLRTRHLVGIFFMTPYILIMFHLLNAGDYKTIIQDRLVDTAIASAIAFLASIVLVPNWEQDQMKNHFSKAITDSLEYFRISASAFLGNPVSVLNFKLSRKSAYVSLANFSEAFARMLEEPKTKQKHGKIYHQLVVMNHMLISHIAALSHFSPLAEKYKTSDFKTVHDDIIYNLKASIEALDNQASLPAERESGKYLVEKVNELISLRKNEIEKGIRTSETRTRLVEFKPIVDQFNFISSLSRDILKTSKKLHTEPE